MITLAGLDAEMGILMMLYLGISYRQKKEATARMGHDLLTHALLMVPASASDPC